MNLLPGRRPPCRVPAYVVALIQRITDPETYQRYVAQVEPTLAPFGGRFLARRPDPERLEGAHGPARAVVLEFPDEAQARAWHASPSYEPVMRLRQSASTGMLLLLPGHGPSAAVREGGVLYVEHVTPDVEATVALLAAAHGWRFGPADDALGGARVAELPGGARCGVRAPMDVAEKPLTRSYVRVGDVEAAGKRAQAAGGLLALPPLDLPPYGRIAIVILGGVELGLWELPAKPTT